MKKRSKGQFLTKNQIIWIRQEVTSKRKTEEEIALSYNISISTLKRVLRVKLIPDRGFDERIIKSYSEWLSSEILINWIESYIEWTKHSFSWKDLSLHITKELDIQLKPYLIRKLLKRRFLKSYKKGSARPTKIDEKKHRWMNVLFWTKLLHTLSSVKRIINIDGWWLSRTIKQSYSWLSRGKSCKIYNTKYTGSMSLLSAISSEGWSFTAAYTSTVNSDIFIQFIENLFRYINKIDAQSIPKTLIIMDNVPYQKTNKVQSVLSGRRVSTIYLPPYSPELAPIELLFRSLKAKLRKWVDQREVSFSSQHGLEIVCQSLKQIRSKEILRYWTHFYKEIKSSLDFLGENL